MNVNFVVNDYILIWNLLFGASISESVHKMKQRIWDTYRKEYNDLFKDKTQIMEDYKNFIPNNDTIYNIVMESKDYEKLKSQAEKYRVEVMKIWDQNKKETDVLYHNIFRKKLPNYTIFIANKELNMMEHIPENNLIVGQSIDKKDELKILLDIHMKILENNIKRYKEEYNVFKKAILELAIYNEYATRVQERSCYQIGDPSLQSLKRQLYPYWLMYLGVPKEDFFTYMTRDKIEFPTDKYVYEKELKKINLEEFIEFCIRNKRYIIRETKQEVEEL